ncbi:MAG: ROK family protein [Thermomicrobiales bacterium]
MLGREDTQDAVTMSDAAVIVVDMGGTKIAGGLADPSSRLSARQVVPTWPGDGPGGIDALITMIERLHEESRHTGTRIRAVGISVAGIVRHRSGIVHLAPNLRWHDFPLRETLEARCGLPVAIGNDAKLATLGEYHAGGAIAGETLFGLWIGTGVGGGIVRDGRILHGAHDAAGEIAYLLPERAALGRRYPDLGALELAVAGPGIAGRAAAQLAASPGVVSTLRRSGSPPQTADIFAAAQQGDAVAGEILAETLETLTLAIANVAVVLDPDRIVFGGAVGLALAPWHAAIVQRLVGRIPNVPSIFSATLGDAAPLVGAASIAWERVSPHE